MTLSGGISDYFVVFWAGVLVSFTPCVYPLIPVTATFIGGVNTKGTRLSGFGLSIIYVFGIALSYGSLGAIAALTGTVFGDLQNNAIVQLLLGWAFIFLALFMVGAVRLPTFGVNLQNKVKFEKKNLWVVLLAGITAGLVIGPCTAPILAGLLLYVGSKQNLFHGIFLLFTFSYGVGASLILVGTFSGLLANLPKSGPWLERIKEICAGILFLAGLYFIYSSGKGLL